MATILVVDDEPDLLLLARMNLQRDGHRVVTASDGRSALAAVRDEAPDVVVLDVMMPDLDGFAVLQEVKASEDERVRSVPVGVMLTAVEGPEARARGGIEGAVRWLSKPFELDDLRAVVQAALDEPELVQRQRARAQALRSIAQIERGVPVSEKESGPRLANLERRPSNAPLRTSLTNRLGLLTDTQRKVVEAVQRTPTVRMAAGELGISRSSVYASLRRSARRLGIRSASQLVIRLRRPDDYQPPKV